ncbi:MAG: hypothetical protein ABL957_13980, partial [Parvularculaceae bacterium]
MRGVVRILWGLAAVIAAAAALLVVFRGPVVGYFLRGSLERAGLEDPAFRVRDVGLGRLTLADLRAPAKGDDPAIDLQSVEATYDLRNLIEERSIKSIALGPGLLSVEIASDGTVSLSNLKIGGAGPARKGLTVGAISLKDVSYRLKAPQGAARGVLKGEIDFETGGALSLTARTEAFSSFGVTLKEWEQRATIELRSDGAASLAGEGAGSFVSAAAAFRGTKTRIEASGQSWRRGLAGDRNALSGQAVIGFETGPSPAAENPFLRALLSVRPQPSVAAFEAGGALRLAIDADVLTVDFGEGGTIRIKSDLGDELRIAAMDDGPDVFTSSKGRQSLAVGASLAGENLVGAVKLGAARERGADWTFKTD